MQPLYFRSTHNIIRTEFRVNIDRDNDSCTLRIKYATYPSLISNCNHLNAYILSLGYSIQSCNPPSIAVIFSVNPVWLGMAAVDDNYQEKVDHTTKAGLVESAIRNIGSLSSYSPYDTYSLFTCHGIFSQFFGRFTHARSSHITKVEQSTFIFQWHMMLVAFSAIYRAGKMFSFRCIEAMVAGNMEVRVRYTCRRGSFNSR